MDGFVCMGGSANHSTAAAKTLTHSISLHTTHTTGRRKRIFGARRIMRYQRPDFKKAYVTLGEGSTGAAGAGAGAAAP